MKVQALIVFFISLIGAHSSIATTGGQASSEEIQASIVNIVFERAVICSGVVLGPRTVLTAAHCSAKGSRAPLTVAFVRPNVSRNECNAQPVVSSMLASPFENENKQLISPDLMLIEIKEPLCGAVPARLSFEKLQENDVVSLGGHGKWEEGHAVSTQFDSKVIEFEVVGLYVNAENNKAAQKNIDRFLQKGPQGYVFALPETEQSSICPGDSGGPVFTEFEKGMVLHGVNGLTLAHELIGADKCGYAYVQAFTPIAPYKKWILDTIQKWN